MMKAFAYKNPGSLQQALASLGGPWGKTDILAGGTDLLALMKEGLESPETVVNIKGIADLSGVTAGDDSIKIGATTTLADVAEHAAVKKHLPALEEAVSAIGGPQIRNMGTLGGSLCQRNRDWYFRNGLSPEVRDQTQYAAIFPIGSSIYVHPSTTAPPLIAYGATVQIAGPSGTKDVPVQNLFQVSDLHGRRETVLLPNEIILSVTIPVKEGTKSADYEVRERDSHDWPLIQASVALTMNGDRVAELRIVLGHVSPLPVIAKAAQEAIRGKELTVELAAAAGKAAVKNAKPLGKNAYKVTLAEVAIKRALLAAVGNLYWRAGS